MVLRALQHLPGDARRITAQGLRYLPDPVAVRTSQEGPSTGESGAQRPGSATSARTNVDAMVGGVKGWVLVVLALLCAASGAVGAPNPDRVRFTAAGDYSSSAAAATVMSGIGAIDPDAHFAVGDLSYGVTGTEQTWCDFVKTRVGDGFPFELLAGNHESNGLNGNINDFAACLPNQLPGLVGTYGRQYFVDVPEDNPVVRYVMISPGITYPDSTWSYAAGTPRYEWTRATIDEARQQGIPWVVVGMHKPCLSVGQYACDSGADINNLLLSRKVDVVLNGHEHLYQRTKQLAHGTGCATLTPGVYDADCVVDSDTDLRAGAGTVFLTVGTGGTPFRETDPTDPDAPYFATSMGLNSDPTHGFGDFDATRDRLSFTFRRTSGGTYTDAFTLDRTAAPANTAPTASFTSTATALVADLDGRGSFDADGTVSSWSWDFGDGTSGTGATTQHGYAEPGTYPVTLTVTDDDGATGSTTRSVTVTSAPTASTLASDDFERSATRSWGSADTGGPWTVNTGTGVSAVSRREGPHHHARRRPRTGQLPRRRLLPGHGPDRRDGSGRAARPHQRPRVRLGDRAPHRGRRVRARVHLLGTGAVRADLLRTVGGARTTLGSQVTVSGLTYAAGESLAVRVQAIGGSPTQLRMKVWRAGTVEPNAWTVTAADSTAGLQVAGSIGVCRPTCPVPPPTPPSRHGTTRCGPSDALTHRQERPDRRGNLDDCGCP